MGPERRHQPTPTGLSAPPNIRIELSLTLNDALVRQFGIDPTALEAGIESKLASITPSVGPVADLGSLTTEELLDV